MNVEYQCPVCGGRLFATPGGTKLKCSRHDVVYEQVEDWKGADFLYVDEKGNTKSHDVIGAGGEIGRGTVGGEPPLPEVDLAVELQSARSVYENETGYKADRRWGISRIQEELEAWQEEQKELAAQTKTDDDESTEVDESTTPPNLSLVEDEVEDEAEVEDEVDPDADVAIVEQEVDA